MPAPRLVNLAGAHAGLAGHAERIGERIEVEAGQALRIDDEQDHAHDVVLSDRGHVTELRVAEAAGAILAGLDGYGRIARPTGQPHSRDGVRRALGLHVAAEDVVIANGEVGDHLLRLHVLPGCHGRGEGSPTDGMLVEAGEDASFCQAEQTPATPAPVAALAAQTRSRESEFHTKI